MTDALIRCWLPETRVRLTGTTAWSWAADWEGRTLTGQPVSAFR